MSDHINKIKTVDLSGYRLNYYVAIASNLVPSLNKYLINPNLNSGVVYYTPDGSYN